MQVHDPPPNSSSLNSSTPLFDQPTMNGVVSPSIDAQKPLDSEATAISNAEEAETARSNGEAEIDGENKEDSKVQSKKSKSKSSKNGGNDVVVVRKERPTRACTVRSKLYVEPPLIELRSRPTKKGKVAAPVEAAPSPATEAVEGEEEDGEDSGKGHCGKIITPLLDAPPPGHQPRWNLRAMWELASILHFFNVFRPLLNITAEFSAEELETSLMTPNDTLSYVHIPLLKAIPPVTRMACGRETWVTVLCRKLRDWWHWVADGDLPIIAAHGAEVEAYKALDPAARVVILKALCDIRVEQEDIRSYIDDGVKQGIQLSTFRKERIGGDSHRISYWYEDDSIIGHRLYREIRKVEVKKARIKGSNVLPSTTYEWETVATNLDEFLDVSEKLFSSKNRTEVSLGKKLKNDFLPEIEKIHKRKEKLLKKQQKEALLLDSYVNMDGIVAGRSLRDRKPVTYTFDDFDRSINEAIKMTKQKQPSPEPGMKREYGRSEPSANGTGSEPSHAPDHGFFSPPSPPDYDEMDDKDHASQQDLDWSNRRRRRSQRYSEREFVEEVSENDRDFDSDDDIVGEADYDEEYLREKKRKKLSSGSEGDEEYNWSEENGEEEEEEEDDSFSMSEDSDGPRKSKKLPSRTRGETKLRLVDELQSGPLRRSKRSTRNRINYQQYEMSGSDPDSAKQDKSNASGSHSAGSDNEDNEEYEMESPDSDAHGDEEDKGFDQPSDEGYVVKVDDKQEHRQESSGEPNSANQEVNEVGKARFLDLNEAAPGSGFEDGPSALMKDAGKSDS